jgi:hypothetical protein
MYEALMVTSIRRADTTATVQKLKCPSPASPVAISLNIGTLMIRPATAPAALSGG